jgi:hypothetical protein
VLAKFVAVLDMCQELGSNLVSYMMYYWKHIVLRPVSLFVLFFHFIFFDSYVSIRAFHLISAMELALALEKLVNEKLHNLHSVSCSYCIACTLTEIFVLNECL